MFERKEANCLSETNFFPLQITFNLSFLYACSDYKIKFVENCLSNLWQKNAWRFSINSFAMGGQSPARQKLKENRVK